MDKASGRTTIITRTKNRTLLLRRAIESIVAQTNSNWEHVIVNDGGDAKGVDALLRAYKSATKGRTRVIHNAKSVGMEAASNVGLKASEGEFCVIHDDDDTWHPNFLEKTVGHLTSGKPPYYAGVATLSTTVMETIEGGEIRELSRTPFNPWMRHITLFRIAAENMFPPISFLYRRSVHDEVGYFDESLPVLGDWDFNLRVLSKFDVAVVPELLAYYHRRGGLMTGDYSNSVVGRADDHQLYTTVIRNKLLRKDFESGKQGIGWLVNTAWALDAISQRLHRLEDAIHNNSGNNVAKYIGESVRLGKTFLRRFG